MGQVVMLHAGLSVNAPKTKCVDEDDDDENNDDDDETSYVLIFLIITKKKFKSCSQRKLRNTKKDKGIDLWK